MKLINWNIRNAGIKQIGNNIDWLLKQDADIWVLSEVNYRHAELWDERLEPHGFRYISAPMVGPYRGAAIVTRLPFKPLPNLFHHGLGDFLTVSAQIKFHHGQHHDQWCDVHAVYCPPDASKETKAWRKQHIIASLIEGLEGRSEHQILAGDFNTPQAEQPNGEWVSFAEVYSKTRGAWYLPDYQVDIGLKRHKYEMEKQLRTPRHDMQCAFQQKRRLGSPSVSWRHYRLDHIIASQSVMPDEVWYTSFLPQGADHRPMFAQWQN